MRNPSKRTGCRGHLEDPDLRILDCAVFLRPFEGRVRPESGREPWEQAHIPGAGFADLLADLSDRDTNLPIMMPPAAQFARRDGTLWRQRRQSRRSLRRRYERVGDQGLVDAPRVWVRTRRCAERRMEEVDSGGKADIFRCASAHPRGQFTARAQASLDSGLERSAGFAERSGRSARECAER